MGFGLTCLRQPSSPQRLADQEATKHEHNRSSSCSDMSFMMFGCFWTKEAKKRPLQAKKKQQKQQKLKKAKQQVNTLEDRLIASPGKLQRNNDSFGGEYQAFKHSSKRVFPSFNVGDPTAANSSSINKPRQSFSKERLLVNSEDDHIERGLDMQVCLSRSQSGKSKKRVSFKLPEEADIFIFHASSGEQSGDQLEI
ncbi:hypothetical protein PTKIN_Ptkin14bG0035200 [Pterospermum kingtungense]